MENSLHREADKKRLLHARIDELKADIVRMEILNLNILNKEIPENIRHYVDKRLEPIKSAFEFELSGKIIELNKELEAQKVVDVYKLPNSVYQNLLKKLENSHARISR
jgi:hypothetical protein